MGAMVFAALPCTSGQVFKSPPCELKKHNSGHHSVSILVGECQKINTLTQIINKYHEGEELGVMKENPKGEITEIRGSGRAS